MSTTLDPIVSEFQTEEQAVGYDRWFRAKVQEAMESTEPRLPHDQVMDEMRALIDSKKQKMAHAG